MMIFKTKNSGKSGFLSRQSLFGIGLIFALAATPLMAEAKGHGKGGARGGLAKELNLTPEQAKQVREIRGKYKERLKEMGAAARTAKKDLVTSLQSPKRGDGYNAELMSKFKDVQAKKQQQHATRFEMALEVRNILTDEQITKFKALHREGKRGHHKKGGDVDDKDDGDDE